MVMGASLWSPTKMSAILECGKRYGLGVLIGGR
jgi:hypothetical protein